MVRPRFWFEKYKMTLAHDAFIHELTAIVGIAHVLTGAAATRPYSQGYREGGGKVLAVVRPGTLRELWAVTKAVVAADKILLMQAANTGLTGGSTPDGNDYDRDIVLVNTLRLDKAHLIDGGRQVVCLPGATLYGLEDLLRPIGREPHSVIGSSCIGASVIGGLCNNSGGALIQRGPVYSELALFARLHADGRLELVNHLGMDLGDTPEDMLARLDAGDLPAAMTAGVASDPDYINHVRDIDAASPARFNADPRRLFEAAGCAGRLVVFAARLDTFPTAPQKTLFCIGTDDTALLSHLRRDMLARFAALPISAEYMHRDAYDIAARYGKDTFLIIYHLGTGLLPRLWRWKEQADDFLQKCGIPHATDRLLQKIADVLPDHLPARLQDLRQRYTHYLLLETADSTAEVRQWLQDHITSPATSDWFESTADEKKRAQLHRFAAAGAAVRYRAVHRDTVADILALDIALPRNETQWFETLPPEVADKIIVKMYYGHFFCHVLHQDYLLKAGADVADIKAAMLAQLEARGAAYPAEHNVGHAYYAPPPLAAFYRQLDPCNAFNPGIGKTSKKAGWEP